MEESQLTSLQKYVGEAGRQFFLVQAKKGLEALPLAFFRLRSKALAARRVGDLGSIGSGWLAGVKASAADSRMSLRLCNHLTAKRDLLDEEMRR